MSPQLLAEVRAALASRSEVDVLLLAPEVVDRGAAPLTLRVVVRRVWVYHWSLAAVVDCCSAIHRAVAFAIDRAIAIVV